MPRIKTRLNGLGQINPMLVIFFLSLSILLFFVFITLSNMIVQQIVSDFSGLIEAVRDSSVLEAIFLSLYSGFLATLISFILGVPTAYLLARKDFIGKRIIESILDIPVVVPHTVAGIALLTIFGANGLIGDPLESIVQFRDALAGTVVAMLFVSAPYLTNSAREGFQSVDPRLENAARSLGAPLWKAFLFVTFPLASRHLLTGSIMCWARAISEFGAVIMLAYYPMVGPTLIYERFTSMGLSESRPIAVLLILVTLTIFVILRMISSGWRRYDRD
ncbi:ABC transporter permease [Methanohalobium sp.]|uniref:ABC transporter permease n=1 Tax=Methanohalobium sp. TaxID=2837493 RepID=UPI0025FC1AF1|nr:ABC transporter permease [Methanohalobium sp.]